MFRGDPAHTGVFAATPPAHLRPKWVFTPPSSDDTPPEPILASPVFAKGVVYVGSNDNYLYAVDAATGQMKWKFKTTGGLGKAGGNIASTVAVSNGVVYFMCRDGNFYAVDAATGGVKWTFTTQGERRFTAPGMDYAQPVTETTPDPWDLYLSSPAVVDGTVYFGCGDNFVYALDAADGSLRWKFKTGDVVHASPAVANGTVYIGSFDTYFYALDARTGAQRWKFKTGEDPVAHNQTGLEGSAAVADGAVYFGCRDSNFYALDAQTGGLRWKRSNNQSWVIASPAVANGLVYYVTSDTHRFIALDAKTGSDVYSLSGNLYLFSSPAIAGNRAYFGSFDGRLRAVDLEKRAFCDEFATPSYRQNAAKYLTADGELKPNVWTGETLDDIIVALYTRVFALGSIVSAPAVADGTVFVTSVDGRLYALGD